MNFSDALNVVKSGGCVRREGWNGAGMWLQLQKPDAKSTMTLPYIFLNYPAGSKAYPDGARVPWLASQTDLLAEDWVDIDSIAEPLPALPELYTWADVAHHDTTLEMWSGALLYRARMVDGQTFKGRVDNYSDPFDWSGYHSQVLDDINKQNLARFAA